MGIGGLNMSRDIIEFEMWLKGIEETKAIVDEAVKIAKDYPELNIREVIAKAKEVIECM